MDTITPAQALEDLALYGDLAAEIEGLRATFLSPMASHPNQLVRLHLATLEACITATLLALDSLKAVAP